MPSLRNAPYIWKRCAGIHTVAVLYPSGVRTEALNSVVSVVRPGRRWCRMAAGASPRTIATRTRAQRRQVCPTRRRITTSTSLVLSTRPGWYTTRLVYSPRCASCLLQHERQLWHCLHAHTIRNSKSNSRTLCAYIHYLLLLALSTK